MRLLLLADEPDLRLWDHLDRSLLNGVDLVLSCGDLPASYLSFLTCFTDAPILYVHGNHDSRYATQPPEGCICIEDKIYEFNGLRILGLGGSMRYKPGPCMFTEKEMRQRVNKLRFMIQRKNGFDILLAHSPMQGVGDADDLAHRGFLCLKNLVEKYHPAYYVHGHVHKSYDFRFQRTRMLDSTTVINAWTSYFIDIDVPERPAKRRLPLVLRKEQP